MVQLWKKKEKKDSKNKAKKKPWPSKKLSDSEKSTFHIKAILLLAKEDEWL